METPKGGQTRLVDAIECLGYALVYEGLLSKNAANVNFLLLINCLCVFRETRPMLAVAKSLQLDAKKKA
jgi:hypothetical protein